LLKCACQARLPLRSRVAEPQRPRQEKERKATSVDSSNSIWTCCTNCPHIQTSCMVPSNYSWSYCGAQLVSALCGKPASHVRAWGFTAKIRAEQRSRPMRLPCTARAGSFQSRTCCSMRSGYERCADVEVLMNTSFSTWQLSASSSGHLQIH
jgi:hypothetical protein